ncbi:hypothetical protein [Nannocystis sp.]|uniref:hypothetical protein n=1 Tax=Nannocystis sp. TaxID=1962667 RepID=UPI0025E13EDB|nr:hypothetical protein [Nannocystis sp.]MBK7826008.1 hypothetical protein [Nannocystis sp.]
MTRPAPRTALALAPSPRIAASSTALALALSPRIAASSTTLALALTLAACASEPATESASASVDPAAEAAALALASDHPDPRAEQARARVDALLAEPGPRTLLAALAQSHTSARALLGPHRLHYKASFSLLPEAPTRPVVDQPIQQEQVVGDELTLILGSALRDPLRMHLSQKTDKGEGREVIILDEQVYTRLAYRSWHARALDSELHQIWLDEAQHCVHDLVELAAPALALDIQDTGDTLELTLRRADALDPTLVAAGHGREWRQRSEIGEIHGSISLDRATGLWRKAELSVAYVVRDVLDRPQQGKAELHATVEPAAAADLVIEAPALATPLPERTRPELERQHLLHGLVGA